MLLGPYDLDNFLCNSSLCLTMFLFVANIGFLYLVPLESVIKEPTPTSMPTSVLFSFIFMNLNISISEKHTCKK